MWQQKLNSVKKIIVFDLDGTLAKSKSTIDQEMAKLLTSLLSVFKIAVISGGDMDQFKIQLIDALPKQAALSNLYVLPTTGAKFYAYQEKAWKLQYSDDLSTVQKQNIQKFLPIALEKAKVMIPQTWGPQLEDRGSQVTFSALGQKAPYLEKIKWDPDFKIRQKIKSFLDPYLPDLYVRLGGTTSIDITQKGVDKAYGIKKISELLQIQTAEMIFVGDAIFPGGNDFPATSTGAYCIHVSNPEETKRVIQTLIACLT